jgi:hypothetical protein
MSIIESLRNGPAKKRDIVLALMLWVIGGLVSIAMSVSATKLPLQPAVDIGASKNAMTSRLVSRIPIPAGQFSVMLPSAEKISLSEDERTIVLKLPVDMGLSGLAVSVELLSSGYEMVLPSMTELRKDNFQSRLSDETFVLNEPFKVTSIQSFEPIVSNGRMGFMARLKGDKADKLYIEVYEDTRRMIFEIAVSKGVLTPKHRDLLYAIVGSVEDFKNI